MMHHYDAIILSQAKREKTELKEVEEVIKLLVLNDHVARDVELHNLLSVEPSGYMTEWVELPDQHRSMSTGWGLYSNGHEDVCVMFASIPNFWDLRTTSQKMVENVSAYSTKLIIADFDRSESPSPIFSSHHDLLSLSFPPLTTSLSS